MSEEKDYRGMFHWVLGYIGAAPLTDAERLVLVDAMMICRNSKEIEKFIIDAKMDENVSKNR